MNLKPIGERVIVRLDKLFKKGTEKDKEPEIVGFSTDGKVLETNVPEIKKGDVVHINPRGAVSVQSMETKKHVVLIIDLDDVLAKVTK